MRLSSLLAALPAKPRVEEPGGDPVIRGVCYDSRAVAPGDLFFAIRGEASDGHDYLAQALERGAAALVIEEAPPGLDRQGRPAVFVEDSRRALAPVACSFYGEPAHELTLIGVTGTNGKTSVTYLTESILARADRRVGLIGTVEIRYPGERQRSLNTTPESLDLQRALRAMRTQGVEAVAMEVSSHGLELGRVAGCRFAVAAFTNLTQDHLDFHETMDAYLAAKTRLFREHLAPGGSAVVNADDPAAEAFVQAAREVGARVIRISRKAAARADVTLEHADVRMDGSRVRLRLPDAEVDVVLPLIGDFNVENLLVAAGIAVALDTPPEAIAAGAAICPQVPGRVEHIRCPGDDAPTVLVDYAHTPDALDKLLSTLQPLTPGRLVSVFGCGGDRDRGKRPLMAEAAARWSDRIVATSDNPRTEEPERILADVEGGLRGRTRVSLEKLYATDGAYAVVVDRREAIRAAIAQSRSDDTVVIAGKGHEDYQILGHERVPFSDSDEAHKALRMRPGA
ncbi:MAG: UDP-N-acetylmuramoyl-L-alanyl-D-glutamate--2,6-diaminopimelate ligase [Myxococcota bacterium]|jgi:UDP-N-acetylmuramoyl-L-alanyl-D-glutamate--2,6-diaminopimelate ligase|nr:UDP-N-acetylmuramoyl-L-alanyl-D-glutamate--2,6-diaminopimelate ligase [Deltaproteobacteria bacterium]MCP4242508.1 UDP-N-acetylmuramoyl-L-alanyl-D-glutamate--2,6-diaminopimelate ligase [bacterium]MDP6074814.1 UDP-N-acetylmuramoyl-L-alanyl-D-glutamate--2,6-diaminopimelate ligase [Myxococcota bacterium]MDP7075742.1 UDP-N-acetylmuramoyl-L-alanyl-D-glutamate--2,6-diaminopimelate ligase [Myxococcota bacterium]MDP7299915.1 UDP-N-acetylmuramoyl-L-alanyl-D-glutamate--2,6-diaminopimelate ligase [Myxoc